MAPTTAPYFLYNIASLGQKVYAIFHRSVLQTRDEKSGLI